MCKSVHFIHRQLGWLCKVVSMTGGWRGGLADVSWKGNLVQGQSALLHFHERLQRQQHKRGQFWFHFNFKCWWCRDEREVRRIRGNKYLFSVLISPLETALEFEFHSVNLIVGREPAPLFPVNRLHRVCVCYWEKHEEHFGIWCWDEYLNSTNLLSVWSHRCSLETHFQLFS